MTVAPVDLKRDNVVAQILSRLDESKDTVKVAGTWGSFAPMLAAHISDRLRRPIFYISPHIDDADNVADDLAVFSGRQVVTFPVREEQDHLSDATDEIAAQRLRIALDLAIEKNRPDSPPIIISTSIQALNQPVPSLEIVESGALSLSRGLTMEPELVAAWLTDSSFERVDAVDLPGQFARRGGIIDIFAPVMSQTVPDLCGAAATDSQAIRVEFFGDTIESIRRIDLDTQRSARQIEKVDIIPSWQHCDAENTQLLVNLLPANTIVILEEPAEIAEVSDVFLNRLEDPTGLYPFSAIYKAMQKCSILEISRFAGSDTRDHLTLDVTSAQQFEHTGTSMWKSKKAVLDDLIAQTATREVSFFCENAAEVKRITEIICESHKNVPDNFRLPIGCIRQGFIVNSLNAIIISHHEVFGQYSVRRRIKTIRSASPVDSLLDLSKGDYIVHASYGIGRFKGIRTMEKTGGESEYLTLEYADKALIHVPVSSIALVAKYVGSMPKRPPLSKIGTKKWQRQKEKVALGVRELAAELLDIQAKRKQLGGFPFESDSTWQEEFEESFLYQDTPDQITVLTQIKNDMQKTMPMDRLLCGDVGYGKTELAIRAAFKAVESGKQVAVLVPTTVLSVQHGRTFTERFADFPVTIGVLNRFVTAKDARQIISDTRKGQLDILIGTHRILSKDVGFKDLGLLIIDEEQRFGVEHKERLKQFKVNVDILTMTATPIPRTLHLSLLGLRDISSLSTPPLDRRAIVTKVCKYDTNTVRRAIMHEVNRDGQVFFLYNRVQTIERAAEQLIRIIDDPDITVDVAHGQMPKHKLEDAMIRFVRGKTQILVCSTIIESGLDIPNANTMIVCDADRFGLAQLHQLRGRVGRYKHRAYAYMLLPMSRTITPLAARRLKAIEEYSQLGAGFRIALRDLEIRGAGNILGSEQSGHINTVGYDLYCKLLSEAVKRLKNEPVDDSTRTVIDIGISTSLPRSYIPSDRQRMDVYRRISIAADTDDLTRLTEELADLFGPLPPQARQLLDLAELRILAHYRSIESIVITKPDLIFSLADAADTADLFARAPGTVRIADPHTVHLRLEKNYFEPRTLMSILRKLLRK